MLRKIKKRTAAYTISACAVLALIGAGLATALASSSAVHTQVPAPAAGSAVARLSVAARASFSAFAQPQGDNEDVRVVDEVLRGDKDLALDPASVRLTQSSNGIQVRLVGDSESVCLVGRIPGKAIWGGCAPNASAVSPATPGIGATTYPPGEVSHPGGQLAIDALFPDGTTNVTVTSPSGSVTPVSIVNNTVAFIASESATLSWTGPEGRPYSASLPH